MFNLFKKDRQFQLGLFFASKEWSENFNKEVWTVGVYPDHEARDMGFYEEVEICHSRSSACRKVIKLYVQSFFVNHKSTLSTD